MKALEGSDQRSTVIWLPFKEIAILAAVSMYLGQEGKSGSSQKGDYLGI